LVDEILENIWGIHLTLLGIALTIFTLLYSFILSKRDFIIELSEIVNQRGESPEIRRKHSNTINYIELLKGVNDKLVVIIIANFSLFLFSWTLRIIVPNTCKWFGFKLIFFYVVSLLTILVLAYLIYLILKVYKHYKKSTKV
jgi:hypothetical protein